MGSRTMGQSYGRWALDADIILCGDCYQGVRNFTHLGKHERYASMTLG